MEQYGEGPVLAALFGIPAAVIAIVAFVITGDVALAVVGGVFGSLLFMVGMMGYAEGEVTAARRRAWSVSEIADPPYDEQAIFDRDHWTCSLCGQAIVRDLGWPDPRSAAIYPALPVESEVRDVPQFVRAAHLVCVELKDQQVGDSAD